jgi:hypothetical protein
MVFDGRSMMLLQFVDGLLINVIPMG